MKSRVLLLNMQDHRVYDFEVLNATKFYGVLGPMSRCMRCVNFWKQPTVASTIFKKLSWFYMFETCVQAHLVNI